MNYRFQLKNKIFQIAGFNFIVLLSEIRLRKRKMTNEKIEKLRESWGDKPCVHPVLKTDTQTQDKVCNNCGRIVYSGRKMQGRNTNSK